MKVYIIHTYKGNGLEVAGFKGHTNTLIFRNKDLAEQIAANMEEHFQSLELSKDWTVAIEECEV